MTKQQDHTENHRNFRNICSTTYMSIYICVHKKGKNNWNNTATHKHDVENMCIYIYIYIYSNTCEISIRLKGMP
jgi:hypothetical protein